MQRHSPDMKVVLAGFGILCLLAGLHPAIAEQIGLYSQTVPETPRSATMPFTLDHNRMIVEVEFVCPDGTIRKARAWVDTGSQYLTLSEPLARDLGFDVSGLQSGKVSVELAAPAPAMRLNGLPLNGDGVRTKVQSGAYALSGVPAEANLPASILQHDYIIFDYPARLLTIARPGILRPKGVGISCRVNAETGLFMIEAIIGGDTVQVGVDNGSAGTWISNVLSEKIMSRHPNWPYAIGAAGSANFFGFPFESGGILMHIPDIEIGGLRVRDVGLLGLHQSMFDWYSTKSAGPVSGFIGANVLKNFRLEIDFPNRMTYWEQGAATEPGDLDIVGLTLRPEPNGTISIASVVSKNDTPVVDGILPGDRLIRVDKVEVASATMGEVVDALRGIPGSTRTLTIERDGKRFAVEATVCRLP
ncbi:MAG: hypothetical protein PHW79_07460 [Candidatus Marinimicrobia bacterium]|nr:hypothetical protein [Candidatus Neomarinimicrobiota bacterium]